jgi:hypothetical protein
VPLNPDLSIAAQTPFTPAERAVLVEKSEALKVGLDKFITACKDDDSQHVVESLIPVAQEYDDIRNLVAGKLARTITGSLMDALGEH